VLWEASSGRRLHVLESGKGKASGTSLTGADGLALTRDEDGVIAVCEAGGRCLLSTACLGADGRLVLSRGTGETLTLSEPASGRGLHVFAGHADGTRPAGLSEDGCLALSTAAGGDVHLWFLEWDLGA
jgi:hypothetical protein